MSKTREKSSIKRISIPNEKYTYIYEDNLRGLSDFARFLRSFGTAVIAIEPPKLRETMINTYTKILEKYADEDSAHD